ncbi:MAG: hypothetical protein GKS05_00385 [Nitrospirales bacterium]|nr:hypothetical protein [Nitrospirales bacterium]
MLISSIEKHFKTQPTRRIDEAILFALRSGVPMRVEHLVFSLPQFTWKEIFPTIERMKDAGIITLYQRDSRIEIAHAQHHLKGLFNHI